MNEKNSLGLDKCFLDLDNPILLFTEWYNEAKKTEINDPNALALGTIDEKRLPKCKNGIAQRLWRKWICFLHQF